MFSRRQQGHMEPFISQLPMQDMWYWWPQNNSAVFDYYKHIEHVSYACFKRSLFEAFDDHTISLPTVWFISFSSLHSTPILFAIFLHSDTSTSWIREFSVWYLLQQKHIKHIKTVVNKMAPKDPKIIVSIVTSWPYSWSTQSSIASSEGAGYSS